MTAEWETARASPEIKKQADFRPRTKAEVLKAWPVST
jgi:hypothetical protein